MNARWVGWIGERSYSFLWNLNHHPFERLQNNQWNKWEDNYYNFLFKFIQMNSANVFVCQNIEICRGVWEERIAPAS